MAEPNVEKIEQLLSIVDMTRDQPTLKPIHDWALTELAKMAAEIAKAEEKEDAKGHPVGVRPGVQQATSGAGYERRS